MRVYGRLHSFGVAICAAFCLLVLANTAAWAGGNKISRKGASGGARGGTSAAYSALRQKALAQYQSDKAAYEVRIASLQQNLYAAQEALKQGGDLAAQSLTDASSSRTAREAAEQRVLAAQESNADYQRLRESYETTKAAFTTARKRVLESPDYKAQYNDIKGLADAARKFGELQSNALANDPAYVKAEREYRAAEALYNRYKIDLFAQDADWAAASVTSRQQSLGLAETKEMNDAKLRQIQAMKISLRSAQAALEQTESNIAAANKPVPRGTANGTGKNGKNNKKSSKK